MAATRGPVSLIRQGLGQGRQFATGRVPKSAERAVGAILPGIEGQAHQGVSSVLTPLKALFYMLPSGVFRLPPASSGYCNIKCLLTCARLNGAQWFGGAAGSWSCGPAARTCTFPQAAMLVPQDGTPSAFAQQSPGNIITKLRFGRKAARSCFRSSGRSGDNTAHSTISQAEPGHSQHRPASPVNKILFTSNGPEPEHNRLLTVS